MGLLDPLRRAVGMTTDSDVREARREAEDLRASADVRDVFAVAAADQIAGMSHAQAGRALHGLSDAEWPSNPDLRWKLAAGAARALADETISRPVRGMDQELGVATNRRVVGEAGRMLADGEQVGGINALLWQGTEAMRDNVLGIMSTGQAARINAGEQIRSIEGHADAEDRLRADVARYLPEPTTDADRAAWPFRASQTRLAMAQTGLLEPDRVVDAAIDASMGGPLMQGALPTTNRYTARNGDDRQRRAMLQGALLRNGVDPGMIPDERPEPAQLTQKQQQEHAALLMKTELARSQAADAPTAVLTGGQPGSGKSCIVRSVGVQFEGLGGAIVIDPDAIRPTLPYMAERIAAGDLDIPDAANRDAGTIAYHMIQIAKQERRNIIVDGTLQNTDRAIGLAAELKATNYHVQFHGMAVSPDLSHARTYNRREEQIAESPTGFGRGVSDEFHDQATKGYGLTVESFQKKASVDSMTFYGADGRPMVGTSFRNGQWVPAVDMKAVLDDVHRNPSADILRSATDTWEKASDAMKARKAPPVEQIKVDGFRDVAREREKTDARKMDPARLHAMLNGLGR